MQETLLYETPCKNPRQLTFKRKAFRPPFKHLSLRQQDILHWLHTLTYLTTKQVARHFYRPGSRKYAERQLRYLYDTGYTNRLSIPVTRRWGTSPIQYGSTRAIHSLDRRGRRFLAEQGIIPERTRGYQPHTIRQLGNIEHTLALNDFLLMAFHGAKGQGWNFEIIEVTQGTNTLHPDSICRLILAEESIGTYLLVELDRGTESQKKIQEKVERYQRFYESGEYERQFGTASCRVVFIVSDCRTFTQQLPTTETDWQHFILRRCSTLNQWIFGATAQPDLFWVAPLYALTGDALFHAPIWEHNSVKVPFISKG